VLFIYYSFIYCVPAAAAKSIWSCPTLCDPRDRSPPGSPVSGILQARTLEWVAISFSNAWKWKVKVKLLSLVWLLATSWTAAYQAPPSMGFSRQEYWSGAPLPSPNHQGSSPQNSQPTKRFVCPTPWTASAKNFPWFKHLSIIIKSSPSPFNSFNLQALWFLLLKI